jgi:DNA-directed RNA polymerase, mitochondrial
MRCKVPEDYVCSLPVHQDGSCNGLQHYAALGRDALGGAAVNLTPGPKPGDVYSDVCAVVKKRMASDRLEPRPGDKAPPKVIEDWEKRQNVLQWLDGKVDRKVVKQTVMTSVYGVTFAGARAQIRARLKEKFEHVDLPVEVKDELTYHGSMYLARLTLESIGELFAGADAIKDWLATCAKMVRVLVVVLCVGCCLVGGSLRFCTRCSSVQIAMERQPVCWITPLGLPVVQPYRQMSSLVVKTLLQDVLIAENDDQLPVSVARQKSAFPPNYVHSLDSTHVRGVLQWISSFVLCLTAGAL